MIKKIAIGSAATLVVGTFLFGRDVFSYISTGAGMIRDTVRSEVPIDVEIEHARDQVDDLLPKIRTSMHEIAKWQVEVNHLEETIARRESELEDQEEAILALSSALESGDTRLVVAGHTYTASVVERDLRERFNRFQVAEDALEQDRQTLAARQETLRTQRETLDEMLSQRQTLQVELDRLEARMHTIEARQSISDLNIDNSHLARCKSLISEIDAKLDVEEELLDAEANFAGLIPVETEVELESDIVDDVAEYFGQRDATAPEPAVALD
jgi:peptidoglycan hydrolase CwlO-like protein